MIHGTDSCTRIPSAGWHNPGVTAQALRKLASIITGIECSVEKVSDGQRSDCLAPVSRRVAIKAHNFNWSRKRDGVRPGLVFTSVKFAGGEKGKGLCSSRRSASVQSVQRRANAALSLERH